MGGLDDVLRIVALVEAVEKQEAATGTEIDRKSSPQARPDIYIAENRRLTGYNIIYNTSGCGRVVEFSLHTDQDSYELYITADGYKMGGDYKYWESMSTKTSSVDCYEAPDGGYVLRLQDIPFKEGLKIELVAREPLVANTILVKVEPFEQCRDSGQAP